MTNNKRKKISKFPIARSSGTKKKTNRKKKKKCKQPEEKLLLTAVRKSTLFYINEAPGPFNPWQHSLVRYLFSAHQSPSPLLVGSLFHSFLFFSFLCFFLWLARNVEKFLVRSVLIPTARNFLSNFTNQWKSFNFVENHLISLRPFCPVCSQCCLLQSD